MGDRRRSWVGKEGIAGVHEWISLEGEEIMGGYKKGRNDRCFR